MAGNHKSGRKPGPRGAVTSRIPVLFTSEERAKIEAGAARMGLSLSAYLAHAGIVLTGTILEEISEGPAPTP